MYGACYFLNFHLPNYQSAFILRDEKFEIIWEFLMDCEKFFKPSVTVDILVFTLNSELNTIEILLIKRKNPPCKDCWAFPGGFIEKDETLPQSAQRELYEETKINIKHDDLTMFYVAGDPGRDPRGRTISIIYYAWINKKEAAPEGGDDAKEARWFSIFSPPTLAFDHANILMKAIGYLKKEMIGLDIKTNPTIKSFTNAETSIIKSILKEHR